MAIAALSMAAAFGVSTPAATVYSWTLPRGFPPPTVPADNPMSEAKVALGRHLFYDARLSANGTQSCAACHQQAKAFTDGRGRGIGSTGQLHRFGPMSLVNVAYAAALTWSDPRQTRLEDQIVAPMYGDHPIELGLSAVSTAWLDPLTRDARYGALFRAAFTGESDPVTRDHIIKAIATFERSIVSARSPYDQYHFDRDDSAISAAAKRGEVLFHSRGPSCFTCHSGIHFSDAMETSSRSTPVELHNTGLYNLAGALSYPPDGAGLYEVTRHPNDVGKFKAPTLRNIAVTVPYMHDGSVATLEDAIDHYAAGGRTILNGPNTGIGRNNANKSATIGGFPLSVAQRAELVAFLTSLTDEELLKDPRLSNPWEAVRPPP